MRCGQRIGVAARLGANMGLYAASRFISHHWYNHPSQAHDRKRKDEFDSFRVAPVQCDGAYPRTRRTSGNRHWPGACLSLFQRARGRWIQPSRGCVPEFCRHRLVRCRSVFCPVGISDWGNPAGRSRIAQVFQDILRAAIFPDCPLVLHVDHSLPGPCCERYGRISEFDCGNEGTMGERSPVLFVSAEHDKKPVFRVRDSVVGTPLVAGGRGTVLFDHTVRDPVSTAEKADTGTSCFNSGRRPHANYCFQGVNDALYPIHAHAMSRGCIGLWSASSGVVEKQ